MNLLSVCTANIYAAAGVVYPVNKVQYCFSSV